MMNVKVYLNEYLSEFYVGPQALRLAARFELDGDEPMAMLNEVFEQLNIGGDLAPATEWTEAYRAAGNRSLSVGDVVVLGETAWTVARFGWEIISTDDLLASVNKGVI
jgi:hypothetical protein